MQITSDRGKGDTGAMQDKSGTKPQQGKKKALQVVLLALTVLDVWLWLHPEPLQGQPVTVYRETGAVTLRL